MLLWRMIKAKLTRKGYKRGEHLYENEQLLPFLTRLINSRPGNIKLYEQAFIHRSAQLKDSRGKDVNFERLEFLGDSVLDLIVSVYMFEEAPDKQEGYLTKMRSKIVSREKLNMVGKKMRLTEMLYHGGNPNLGDDIHGNLLEALVGAIYMDKGFRFTGDFVFGNIIDKYFDLDKLEKSIASHKSLILEWGQKTKNRITFNTFEEENAEDLTVFISIVRMNDKVISKGRGTSKKRAEENASKRAYYALHSKMENVL